MTLISRTIDFAERTPLPDAVIRAAIHMLCARTANKLSGGGPASDAAFAREMALRAIAEDTDAANAQHYEVPAEFFELVLGPNRKYSSCYYPSAQTTLAEAEDEALTRTIANADLRDGQTILELGCGWGSLSLRMAQEFPNARIVGVSNSHSQRISIERRAAEAGLRNLQILTQDMNAFAPTDTFDRVVSVEMFEHMMSWRALLGRVKQWMKPDARFFMHIFTHKRGTYLFDRHDREDWIAQHFFTGGVMPSHGLIRQYADLFSVEQEWRWSGIHYSRTAEDWLANFDRHRDAIRAICSRLYGAEAALWMTRWRWFFLATSGLFGYPGGDEWGVSHYRLRPVT